MIVLPLPPSVWNLYGRKGKLKYITKEYKAWIASCPKIEPKGYKKLSLVYVFYFPDKRRRDISNYIKGAEDYLVSQGFIEDDNFNCVYEFRAKFGGIDKNSRVEIGIEESSN